MKLDELIAAESEARRRLQEIRHQVSVLRDHRLQEFKQCVESEIHERFGAELESADDRLKSAGTAVLEAKEQAAKTGEGSPYPLGTRLYQWKSGGDKFSYRGTWKATGVVGVVEAVTRESVFPSNMRSFRPSIGEFVIRHLDKKGNPGKRFSEFGSGWRERWLREGQAIDKDGKVVNVSD